MAQDNAHQHPRDEMLVNTEHLMALKLAHVKKEYASFLQQKAKVDWINFGDENTSFFHNSLKHRYTHNRINQIHIDGVLVYDPHIIQNVFTSFYIDLMYRSLENRSKINMKFIDAGPSLLRI